MPQYGIRSPEDTTYGPLQAAHHRLRRNAPLKRYLNALSLTKGRSISTIVTDACVELYAPNLAERDRPTYRQVVINDKPSQYVVHEIVKVLRFQRQQTGHSIAELVEQACVTWVHVHVTELLPPNPPGGVYYEQVILDLDEQAWHDAVAEDKAQAERIKNAASERQAQSDALRAFLTAPAEDATMPEHTP